MSDFYQKNLSALFLHNPTAHSRMMEAMSQVVCQKIIRQPINIELGDFCFFMHYGLDNGIALRKVLASSQTEGVLIYEPSLEICRSLLSHTDYTDIFNDPRVCLIVGQDVHAIELDLKEFYSNHILLIQHVFHSMTVSSHEIQGIPGYQQSFHAFSEAFNRIVDWVLKRISQPNEEDAFRGLLNTLRVATEYYDYPTLNQLKDIHKNKPAVVVGTGPSLSHSLPFLKESRDNFIIICCDTAYALLKKEGITPDFVCSIERARETEFVFSDMIAEASVSLIAPAVVGPYVLNAFKGPKIQFHRDFDFDDWFISNAESHYVGRASSVSHVAYLAARVMACDPVLLIGQDLAYDPQSHASHDVNVPDFIKKYGEQLRDHDDRFIQLKLLGNSGKEISTLDAWYKFSLIFEQIKNRLGGQLFNVIPKDYGIPIRGSTRLDPETAFQGFVNKAEPMSQNIITNFVQRKKTGVSRDSVKQVYEGLVWLEKMSLDGMRQVSEFWADHDPSAEITSYDKEYDVFFKGLQVFHSQMQSERDQFFHKKFLKIAAHSYAKCLAMITQARYNEPDKIKRMNALIDAWCNLFSLIHLWSARARQAIEFYNINNRDFLSQVEDVQSAK